MLAKMLVALLVGVITLSLAACAPSEVGIPTTGEDQTPSAETSLASTRWRLVSYGQPGSETPVMEGTEVNLQFEDDNQSGGFGGCNTFGAQYEVSDGNQLSVTNIVSTLMACNDEGLMDQETRYLDALQSAESFELTGDSLMIRYGGGVLNFSRVTSSTPSTVHM
jgi:heat shock protein HslJ